MRSDLETRLRDRLGGEDYLVPDYGSYCFGHVPDTVQTLLDADVEGERPLSADVLSGVGTVDSSDATPLDDRYDRVLVVVLDGFGLEPWTRFDHPLLERFEDSGTVTPLTSIYPSETAAALTTFHTGRLPASHGVLGWDVYDPADDAAYEAFSTRVRAGDDAVEYDLEEIFEGEPIYPKLVECGVDCRHVVPFEETYDGAACHTYGNPDGPVHGLEGFESALAEAFAAADDPAYLFAYVPEIDTIAHAYGTSSEEYDEAVSDSLSALERGLARLETEDEHGDTLLVLTADHGHVDTDPERNVDLETVDGVTEALERHADGEPVRYAGSPRNLHLHLHDPDERREAVHETLLDTLDAKVFTREEVLDRNLFGDGEESDTFHRRLGDLVVCHRELSVWYGSDPTKLELIGMHGGLHPDEMLVPFAAVELEELSRELS
ncbi:alkaline phosphatase family protein [Natronobacterium texcoconense]|uniref:Predicted pyrophosphatase or phosphodiesterase, AlkP superfamily n=1 Tax=Natronobacterium texcoconense TaxID=1095778 RepID=A0A1H1FHI5_NATTX|nr:alkaline phosphatase family protein [Natronobacterium texcoconense]SDR00405.1 Predicted pyrophosphatase or phosphodiesterase, AlkP superfamily [Natronobacterium texcoconense]